jgi:hypothetical protein
MAVGIVMRAAEIFNKNLRDRVPAGTPIAPVS